MLKGDFFGIFIFKYGTRYSGLDLAEWLEHLTANAVVATALGPIPASSDTVESEVRQMKQCWISYWYLLECYSYLSIAVPAVKNRRPNLRVLPLFILKKHICDNVALDEWRHANVPDTVSNVRSVFVRFFWIRWSVPQYYGSGSYSFLFLSCSNLRQQPL